MKTLGIGVLALTAAGAAAFMRPHPEADPGAAVATRAPFVETIVESGTLTASRLALYGAPLGALPSKIVEIAPEGMAVEAGELLVRLDTAPLEQLLAREAAALRRAEAELRVDREGLQMKARAEQVQLLEAEAALAEAEREVVRARAALDDFRPMLAEGFITRPEFDRAGQALLRAEEQRTVAKARRDLRAEARPQTGSAASGAVDEIALRIDALRRQIAMSTIRAVSPGLVVYRELFFGSERRKPQVGDEALPNQPLIAVPDPSALIVETRVREIDLHRVASSQRVTVRLDAYPGLVIDGVVDVVGALAQPDVARAGTRYFPLTIRLARSDPRLRSGMTAQVRVDVGSIPSALLVPLEAVFEDDEGTYCLVSGEKGATRRSVDVWARNDTHAAIKSGLREGERVRLSQDRR